MPENELGHCDNIQQVVGPERRGREVIADFQLPIVDFNRAARSTPALCRLPNF